MTAHTPGPWLNDHNTVRVYVGGNLEIVTVAPEWNALAGVAEVNAARIVACVNACEGMETPDAYITELESKSVDYDRIWRKLGEVVRTLRAERAALRAALQEISDCRARKFTNHISHADHCISIARAALAQGDSK